MCRLYSKKRKKKEKKRKKRKKRGKRKKKKKRKKRKKKSEVNKKKDNNRNKPRSSEPMARFCAFLSWIITSLLLVFAISLLYFGLDLQQQQQQQQRVKKGFELLDAISDGLQNPNASLTNAEQAIKAPPTPPPPPSGPTYILAGIMSRPKSRDRRGAIRASWVKVANETYNLQAESIPNFKALFIIGQTADPRLTAALEEEQALHQDLFRLDYPDGDYMRLSLKTQEFITKMVTGFPDFQYLMKVDDDAYADLDMATPHMPRPPREPLILGCMFGQIEANGRTAQEIHKAGKEDPHYPSGPAYIMSRDVAEGILEMAAEGVLIKRAHEDVSMGYWRLQYQERTKRDVKLVYLKGVSGGCEGGSFYYHFIPPSQFVCMAPKVRQRLPNVCCGNPAERQMSPDRLAEGGKIGWAVGLDPEVLLAQPVDADAPAGGRVKQ